jgi:hypothetical protein
MSIMETPLPRVERSASTPLIDARDWPAWTDRSRWAITEPPDDSRSLRLVESDRLLLEDAEVVRDVFSHPSPAEEAEALGLWLGRAGIRALPSGRFTADEAVAFVTGLDAGLLEFECESLDGPLMSEGPRETDSYPPGYCS